MNKKIKRLNNKFYLESYEKYGISAKGVHWYSKDSQYTRFKILVSFLKDLENSTILDVGCGFGDILTFLDETNIIYKNYLGIDCEGFMIQIASKRFPNNKFLKCDILNNKIPISDYLVCSGALNVLPKKLFLEAIKNCFEVSTKGFSFNFLTEKSMHELGTDEIYIFCKTLTNKVSISEEYLHNDLTFYLEK